MYYRENSRSRPITYELAIDSDKSGRPYVAHERLHQRREGQTYGRPYSFLWMIDGEGEVWKGRSPGRRVDEDNQPKTMLQAILSSLLGEVDDEESSERERIQLQDKRRLGIATLGALKQHPRISVFRQFIEGWYLSNFTSDAARSLPLTGPQRHLNTHGDNLSNVVQFMEREYPDRFGAILRTISSRVPGIERVDT